MDERSTVILDKSYLQAISASSIAALDRQYRFVISDALFYELLSCEHRERTTCFIKLGLMREPLTLVSHISPLLQQEIATHRPATLPSAHRLEGHLRFHPDLMAGAYIMPAGVRCDVEEHEQELKVRVDTLVDEALLCESYFPVLLGVSDAERDLRVQEYEAAIARPGELRSFYASLVDEQAGQGWPLSEMLDPRWALYRWMQVKLLFALDLYVRHRGKVALPMTPRASERLEHDVLDAELLMLGCLEGAFATNEKKLKRWFRHLCPGGLLLEVAESDRRPAHT